MTKIYLYRHAMKPYPVGRSTAHERSGLYLCRTHGDAISWSEAAPLPAWSRESIDDVVQAVRSNRFDAFPSLQFAHDALQDSLVGTTTVSLNALLTGDREQIVVQAMELARSGYPAVKLKVGRASLEEDIEIVHAVRNALRDDQLLRLDANRAWQLHDAIRFGTACRELGIEYIEEPVDDPIGCDQFTTVTGVPYALDETIVQGDIPLSRFREVGTFVIKPTLLGGRRRIVQLAKMSVPLVFSSAFESRIGLAHIARLAAEFSPGRPVGLDTHRWLLDNTAAESLQFEDGDLVVKWPMRVDTSRLEEIIL